MNDIKEDEFKKRTLKYLDLKFYFHKNCLWVVGVKSSKGKRFWRYVENDFSKEIVKLVEEYFNYSYVDNFIKPECSDDGVLKTVQGGIVFIDCKLKNKME